MALGYVNIMQRLTNDVVACDKLITVTSRLFDYSWSERCAMLKVLKKIVQ